MTRILNLPRPARVRWDDGMPTEVNGEAVSLLRESWLVEDRWWTAAPLRRRYWELVSERGRNVIVFHDLTAGAPRAHGPQDQASEDRAGCGGGGGWFIQGS
jgi:hypothetical protein